MAYSTCSFNPVENEAVVAELLRRTRGAVQVIPLTAMAAEVWMDLCLFSFWVSLDFLVVFGRLLPMMEGGLMTLCIPPVLQ